MEYTDAKIAFMPMTLGREIHHNTFLQEQVLKSFPIVGFVLYASQEKEDLRPLNRFKT